VTTQVEGVRIESWEPVEQRVHLEEVRTLLWPVAIDVEGEVATGYETTSTLILPNRVQLTGPNSLLEQVTAVGGSIDVAGATDEIVEEVVVRPLDGEGRLVPGLQWAPDRVTVRIGVRSKVGYKPDVEVVPDLNVVPAEGYRLGNLDVDPPLVTLEGPPDVLDQMPGFVETLPISYSNVTANLAHQTTLTVPNGVVVVGVNFVTVTVEILPILSSKTVTSPVEILGIRQGWEATVTPSLVDVSLEGPQLLLDGLGPEDIRVFVNVADYPLGVDRVVPDVLAPEGVTVVNVFPETVEVVLTLIPPDTPTVTVTPTLTITPTGTVEP
jgi:YbbR domain-containing protein